MNEYNIGFRTGPIRVRRRQRESAGSVVIVKLKIEFMTERICHLLLMIVEYFVVFLMMLLMTIVLMVILKAFLGFLNAVRAVVITTRASPAAEGCVGSEMENHLYSC